MKVILLIHLFLILLTISKGETNGFSVEIYHSEIEDDTSISAISSVKYYKHYLFIIDDNS